ncbi:hypothetical protein [Paraburkholderia tropica]|uniref:hypothetical protein n=1 Tax=Paraburkholderia tropica TaxID=92647 RepID=UPI002AB767F7|nr:hypothetical protein [Paraburkholderia tropica]
MNEHQLRAIHAQACAAVARIDRNLSPDEDGFWPLYLMSAIALSTATPPPAPRRAIIFRVDVQADTKQELSDALFDLSNRVSGDDLSSHSISGGYGSGYEHWLTVHDGPTHDEYVAQLDDYLKGKAAVQTEGNPHPIGGDHDGVR